MAKTIFKKRKKGSVHLPWVNLTNITSARWSKSTSTMRCQVDSKYPLNVVTVLVFYLRDLLSNTQKPSLIQRKTLGTPQERHLLQNTWPVILKTVKVIKDKESLRNCHSEERPKETKIQGNVESGMGSCTRERILGKTKEIWIKCGLWELFTIFLYI